MRPRGLALCRQALPDVRERFTEMGYGEEQLQAVLGWIQERQQGRQGTVTGSPAETLTGSSNRALGAIRAVPTIRVPSQQLDLPWWRVIDDSTQIFSWISRV